jgi:uncharacterized heparinase superfamily protein
MASAIDLASRIRRRIRSKVTRLQHRLGSPTLETGPASIAASFRHPIDAKRKAKLIALYRSKFHAAAEREIAEAQRLMRHEFHFLSHSMNHGRHIAWSRDPVTGKDWSREFSADISYHGSDRLGDIKLPWELNKHQYFFTLGKVAWLTGDAAYAREITEQIDDWISDNPCHSGIHWISALEAGTRVISWILAYPFFAEYCDSDFITRMLRALAQHLLFVEQNLSVGEFANTHLAGEAAILIIGGLFVEGRHSKRWLELGLHHLNAQIRRQVRSDGVHAEQSVAYHRFFLDQYILTHAMLRANGRSLPAATLERMEHMTQFLMDVIHPDGSVPSFGDGDDARGVWCRADAPKDYRSILVLGALIFGRGDFKTVAGESSEELLWLHAESGIQTFADLPSRAPDHTSVAYPNSGYYVMRGGWGPADPVSVFDCGPLGLGPAGHGHADALSLQLFANGYPFLVDPGTYSYNIDYEWRDAFRSTRAHNTVVVDEQDQSLGRDRMSWTTMARAHCHRWITTSWFDLIDGEHDGYRRLTGPVSHRRVVVFIKPDVWIVLDHLSGRGRHDIEMFLHLRPDCVAAAKADRTLLTSPTGGQLWASILERLPESAAFTGAFTCNSDSWFSAAYGEKVRTSRLQINAELDGTCTVISGFTTALDAAVHACFVHGGMQIELKRSGQAQETLYYAIDAACQSKIQADLKFDGDVLYQRRPATEGGALWAAGFRQLAVDGYLDVHSETRIKSMSLHGDICDVVCGADQKVDPEIKAISPLQINMHGS